MTILTRTWAILVSLTLLSLTTMSFATSVPAWTLNAAVLLAGAFKAFQILRHFLEVNRASSGWRTLLYGYLVAIFGLLLAISVSA
ncbi:uncharacterized membrane protein HdeD (DUF308 family) [Skermanella aerolata]|uniref:cytochrome C oxidase subunit IV family protein n=1 Tax=Skermanella aerolata TaxID=393310 RepID=UPI003D1EBAC7